jgi:Phage terminase large subunit gpA, ATPase domain
MALLIPVSRFDQAAVDADLLLLEQAMGKKRARQMAREAIANRPNTVLEWAQRYRRIEGQDFSLRRFAPLEDIYADTHPWIVVIKPAQRGLSEWAINTALYALDLGNVAWGPKDEKGQPLKDGINVGYIFPTEKALGDFSKERLTGLEEETPELHRLLHSHKTDSTTFKQVGRSYLYLRGGWSERALLSFPADLMIVDEFDRMDPVAIALARKRMNASEIRYERALSTPTLPGIGIHALYLESDRRRYETRCLSCGEWSSFDFFRDVRVDGEPWERWQKYTPAMIRRSQSVSLHCPVCKAEVPEQDRIRPGRWVVDQPDAPDIHGYWVPWWPFPMVRLRDYAANAVNPLQGEQQEFFRSDLGLPYTVGGSRITSDMLLGLSENLPNGKLPDLPCRQTVMGVDVGSVLHYSIDSIYPDDPRPTVRVMGTVDDFSDLDDLMAQYRIRMCVIDSKPELHEAKKFSDRHPGKVLRADYPTMATALVGNLFTRPHQPKDESVLGKRGRFAPNKDEGERATDIVQINRTMALDALRAAVIQAEERWPEAIVRDQDVQNHLCASVRVTHLDKHGQEVADWVHTAPDHWAHASVYRRIARLCLPKLSGLGGLSQSSAKGGWTGTKD